MTEVIVISKKEAIIVIAALIGGMTSMGVISTGAYLNYVTGKPVVTNYNVMGEALPEALMTFGLILMGLFALVFMMIGYINRENANA